MPTKQFLMLTTGGTIAGNVATRTGPAALPDDPAVVAPATLIEASSKPEPTPPAQPDVQTDLEDILRPTLNRMKADWNIDVHLSTTPVTNVDSSDILPAHWTGLAEAVAANYDAYDGFIVTHGTNTMGYTCAALSFALSNLSKPVVVTGSQVPFGWPASDALMNLDNAVRVAAYPHLGGVRGVVCVFGSYIITGTRAKKSTEFDLDAFQSFSSGGLGRIGRIIHLDEANLALHHSYLSKPKAPAVTRRDLAVSPEFDMRILSFTEFPGMSPEMFRAALEPLVTSGALRGLIFRAFGAGDVSHHLHPVLEYLATEQVPVLVTTQAPNGNSNFQVNSPGQDLAAAGWAIPAHDMSIEAITTKLAWLLARGVSYAEMLVAMHTNLHGEVNVLPDLT